MKLNGVLMKSLSVLAVAGILGNFGFAWNTNARVAVLCREIESLQITKALALDVTIALEGLKENHSTMKDEAKELRERMREIEKILWGDE